MSRSGVASEYGSKYVAFPSQRVSSSRKALVPYAATSARSSIPPRSPSKPKKNASNIRLGSILGPSGTPSVFYKSEYGAEFTMRS